MRSTALLLLSFSACVGRPHDAPLAPPVPLRGVSSAYEAAAQLPLAKVTPMELSGLHNVFRLSRNLVSGSEPHGEAAFVELQKLGVRTIVSVDGAVPDAALAEKYGMRYVHVPIHYKGIAADEALRLGKTFRELPGPFFVHCFHGKHRGPAAAALARCLIDGASRPQAIAEMRQWMGTAPEYEGLYQTIATQRLPTVEETAAYRFDFPAEHRAEGFVAGMVELARAFDNVKDAAKHDFATNPAHPDLDALHEARKVERLLEGCRETEASRGAKPDFRGWMDEANTAADELVAALERMRKGTDGALAEASGRVGLIGKACKACHKVYRDD